MPEKRAPGTVRQNPESGKTIKDRVGRIFYFDFFFSKLFLFQSFLQSQFRETAPPVFLQKGAKITDIETGFKWQQRLNDPEPFSDQEKSFSLLLTFRQKFFKLGSKPSAILGDVTRYRS